jgi:hypothetical protein
MRSESREPGHGAAAAAMLEWLGATGSRHARKGIRGGISERLPIVEIYQERHDISRSQVLQVQ